MDDPKRTRIKPTQLKRELERAQNVLRFVDQAFSDMPASALTPDQLAALRCVDEAVNP
jgi:hypothetical protein